MKFSIVIITKNEANTLPRLFKSLEEFKSRGGEVCLLDTGSTDATSKIAAAWGAKVFSGRFNTIIDQALASKINKKFLEKGELPIVETGNTLFNFAEARNYITSKATNDMVCTLDADEAYTRFDIEAINKKIEEGYEQFEYQFVYAHDQFGNAAVQFIQSKFFNRTKAKWTGIVHEVINGETKRLYLDESIIKLEHFQEGGKEHRNNYLPGLAYDCFQNPSKDRQSHYFAREMMYSNRPKSAIKEFKRHITMGGWQAERAQSMIFIGQCYGKINQPGDQLDWYHRAFDLDSKRRAALIELACFMRVNNNPHGCAAYAAAAIQIPWTDYYANEKAHYENLPHELLYWAKGWMGDIPGAQEHLLKALLFQPYNEKYLHDTKYYFEYHDCGIVGWMGFDELLFLYNEAKKHKIIVEVGSWKGRSTHALLSGCKGIVTAVDTFKGSVDVRDDTSWLAKQEDIFAIFKKNVGDFPNLKIIQKTSVEAAKEFPDHYLDMVFIDAGHTYEDVKADIAAWLPKVKLDGVICGHDYLPETWMGVCQAVDEEFGKIERHGYSIWKFDLKNRTTWEVPIEYHSIPMKIYTAWLSDDPMPENIKKCIETQKLPGYDHHVFTLDNLPERPPYLNDAICAKKWVKAVDYLRMWTLEFRGGIFLDADVEILLGKNFDYLLHHGMFVGKEVNNPDGSIVLGTAVVGAEKFHPLICEWRETVEKKFKGDDDFFYESSMDLLNTIGVKYQDKMHIVEPDIFYPYNHFTGQTEFTERTVAIHHFLKSWVPKTESGFLEDFTYAIRAGTNFTFVKRGDGEVACMSGEIGSNCDGHYYSNLLGDNLIRAFEQLRRDPVTFVVDFENQKNYNILLHRTDNDPSKFWKSVRDSERTKIFIGPPRLKEVINLMQCDIFIEIPPVNAYDHYSTILEGINIVRDAIYIFCAGMPAKCLIAEMHLRNPHATYIDAGSAFDPLVSQTRTFQMSRQEILFRYADTMKGELIKKINDKTNFYLPQATHPERMWVLDNIDPTKKILDLGCGTHKTLPEAIGMDIRPGVTDMQGDIHKLNFNTESQDIIISRHSFEHVLGPTGAMLEWLRVLKPNSKIVIILPDHGSINTMDTFYSAGEHLHAYTMESFRDFLKLFPNIYISKLEVVLPNWSFGAILNVSLPKVSIIIPSLGRPEGLKRLYYSIADLNYPQKLIQTIEVEGEETVPEKMKIGVQKSTGEIICYAANDMEFTPDSLLKAVEASKDYGLVAFNSGPVTPDEGNICEHFIIRKDFIDGDIFDTRLHHCGVDNLLWAKAKKLGQAFRCDKAVIVHHHFSRDGKMDSVYEKGWSQVNEDRETLKQLMKKI